MKVEYDDDADALYIAVRKGQYKISEEISDDVIIDLDKNCRILGIEILGISSSRVVYSDKCSKQRRSLIR